MTLTPASLLISSSNKVFARLLLVSSLILAVLNTTMKVETVRGLSTPSSHHGPPRRTGPSSSSTTTSFAAQRNGRAFLSDGRNREDGVAALSDGYEGRKKRTELESSSSSSADGDGRVDSSSSSSSASATAVATDDEKGASADDRDESRAGTIKAVVFDVDGTLADSFRLGFDATNEVLRRNGIDEITESVYHECTRYTTPDRMARHAGYFPGDDGDDDSHERVGRKLGREFDDLYIDLVSMETAAFFPGTTDMLLSIPSHVHLGALTNAAVRYADAVLLANLGSAPTDTDQQQEQRQQQQSDGKDPRRLSLKERFRSVRGADNVPAPKPRPDGLLTVCDDIGRSMPKAIRPDECLYVGDSPSDAVAANAAGMVAVGVSWGSHSADSLRRAPFATICHTVPELQRVLLRYCVPSPPPTQ